MPQPPKIVVRPLSVSVYEAPIRGWNVRLSYGSAPSLQQAWNATVTAGGTTLSATNAGYNGTLAAGASTTFGFIAGGPSAIPTLTCSGAA